MHTHAHRPFSLWPQPDGNGELSVKTKRPPSLLVFLTKERRDELQQMDDKQTRSQWNASERSVATNGLEKRREIWELLRCLLIPERQRERQRERDGGKRTIKIDWLFYVFFGANRTRGWFETISLWNIIFWYIVNKSTNEKHCILKH